MDCRFSSILKNELKDGFDMELLFPMEGREWAVFCEIAPRALVTEYISQILEA